MQACSYQTALAGVGHSGVVRLPYVQVYKTPLACARDVDFCTRDNQISTSGAHVLVEIPARHVNEIEHGIGVGGSENIIDFAGFFFLLFLRSCGGTRWLSEMSAVMYEAKEGPHPVAVGSAAHFTTQRLSRIWRHTISRSRARPLFFSKCYHRARRYQERKKR